jgi:hypothetical protein
LLLVIKQACQKRKTLKNHVRLDSKKEDCAISIMQIIDGQSSFYRRDAFLIV